MAGDWMKIQMDTPDKEEVSKIAEQLNVSVDDAFGKCFRVWSWFDKHTKDGRTTILDIAHVDRFVSLIGFGKAMKSVGWLRIGKAGIYLPRFNRHNGTTAKMRATGAVRQQNHRSKTSQKCHKKTVTKPRQKRDQRREEKRTTKTTLSGAPKTRKSRPLWDVVAEVHFPTSTEGVEARITKNETRLKALKATPKQYREQYRLYPLAWPDREQPPTPEAVVKYWEDTPKAAAGHGSMVDAQCQAGEQAYQERQAEERRNALKTKLAQQILAELDTEDVSNTYREFLAESEKSDPKLLYHHYKTGGIASCRTFLCERLWPGELARRMKENE